MKEKQKKPKMKKIKIKKDDESIDKFAFRKKYPEKKITVSNKTTGEERYTENFLKFVRGRVKRNPKERGLWTEPDKVLNVNTGVFVKRSTYFRKGGAVRGKYQNDIKFVGKNITINKSNIVKATLSGYDLKDDAVLKIAKAHNLVGKWQVSINGYNGKTIISQVEQLPQDLDQWWENAQQGYTGDYQGNMIWQEQERGGEARGFAYDGENFKRNYKEMKKWTFTFEKMDGVNYNPKPQKFLDGVNHCVFYPILQWARDKMETSKSSDFRGKCRAIINKIEDTRKVDSWGRKSGDIGLLKKYKHGLPTDEIQMVCDELRIGMVIMQLFVQDPEKFMHFKPQLKACKVFRFLNVRMDHVECIGDGENKLDVLLRNDYKDAIVLTESEMQAKVNELDLKKVINIVSKGKHGIPRVIYTMDQLYTLSNDFFDTMQSFEEATGLKYCYIDMHEYPRLTKFIYHGTHFNATVDNKDNIHLGMQFERAKELALESGVSPTWSLTTQLSPASHPDTGLCPTVPPDTGLCPTIVQQFDAFTTWKRETFLNKIKELEIHHIDQEKAYSQFWRSKYYTGFMGKITDFRQVDNYDQKGMYYIRSIDLSNVGDNDKRLLAFLGWFEDQNIYTDAELTFLHDLGATFVVTHGAFGIKLDWKFTDEMMTKDDFVYTRNDEDVRVPYYSMYAGRIASLVDEKRFHMKGSKEFFETLDPAISSYNNISFMDYSKEACIVYPKKRVMHARHITAQIVAYQRLNVFDQLRKMDFDKVIRVCVDGIYFLPHEFDINDEFRPKDRLKDMKFGNGASDRYLSHMLKTEDKDRLGDILPIAGPRAFYMRQVVTGPGGCGKTYQLLKDGVRDEGMVNVVFVTESNKLCSSKRLECMREWQKRLPTRTKHRLVEKSHMHENLHIFNNIIFDEASMFKESDKRILFKYYPDAKLYFCGDLKYQVGPVIDKKKLQVIAESHGEMLGLPPVEVMPLLREMDLTGFENHTVEDAYNWRSGDDPIMCTVLHTLRQSIEETDHDEVLASKASSKHKRILRECLDLVLKKFGTITPEELEDNYKVEDMILTKENVFKDQYTDMFPQLDKFRIKTTTNNFDNGEIVYCEPPPGVQHDFQHGFTCHSLQGETAQAGLMIDLRKMNSIRMLYTSVSRAKRAAQIKIIADMPAPVKCKYHGSFIYKLVCKDPSTQDFYIGSTVDCDVRWAEHQSACVDPTNKAYDTKKYRVMRANGGVDNWYMEKVTECVCSNHRRLLGIEQSYITDLKPSMNDANAAKPVVEQTGKIDVFLEQATQVDCSKDKGDKGDKAKKDEPAKLTRCEVCDQNVRTDNIGRHNRTAKHLRNVELAQEEKDNEMARQTKAKIEKAAARKVAGSKFFKIV